MFRWTSRFQTQTVSDGDDLDPLPDVYYYTRGSIVDIGSEQRLVDHVSSLHLHSVEQHIQHFLLQTVTEVVWSGQQHLPWEIIGF